MGSGRPNWYYDHPPACTCAACNEMRLRSLRKPKGFTAWIKRSFSFFSKRRR